MLIVHIPTAIVTKYVQSSEIGVQTASIDKASSNRDSHCVAIDSNGRLKGTHYTHTKE